VSAGGVTSAVSYAAGTFTPLYDLVLELSMAPYSSASVARARFVYITTAQVPGGTAYNFAAALTARMGSITQGQRAFVRVYRQNLEGYRSAPTALNVAVTA
jgi:hypothetical protein